MASPLLSHTAGTNETSEFESMGLLYPDQSNSPLQSTLLKIELAITSLLAPPMPLSPLRKSAVLDSATVFIL
jgi:hypothetical protein